MTTNPAKSNRAEDASAREIVITRTLNAPRELAFKMMSEAQHVAEWWGPNGFSTSIRKMDFRTGGEWELVMHGPDGADYPNYSTFTEIVPNQRICYDHGAKKGAIDKSFVWTFEDAGAGKTKLTMRIICPTPAARDELLKFGVMDGGSQTLQRFDDYAASRVGKPFTISRVFKVPRALMFKVWTEKEHFLNWFGPKGFEMKAGEFDLRPGGTFHYCMKTPQGQEMWGKAYYRDVVKEKRIVWITTFSDAAGNLTRHPMAPDWPREMLTVATFEDHPDGTKVTINWTPMNATAAEHKVFDESHAGMNGGWSGTFEQLENYLSTL